MTRRPPAARLTEPQVLEIRSKWASGTRTQGELALEYGVSLGAIRNVVKGYSWQNLESPDAPPVSESAIAESESALRRLLPPDSIEQDDPLESLLSRITKKEIFHATSSSQSPDSPPEAGGAPPNLDPLSDRDQGGA